MMHSAYNVRFKWDLFLRSTDRRRESKAEGEQNRAHVDFNYASYFNLVYYIIILLLFINCS